MKKIYLMLPLLTTQTANPSAMCQQIEGVLGLNSDGFQVHEVTRTAYCVEVAHFNLCFTEVQSVFQEYAELSKKIALIEEVFLEYGAGEATRVPDTDTINIEALLRKVKKFKQVKEENKKLKKLLQMQCENAQKMCEQTHKTVKKLKEEVNALVHEVSQKQGNINSNNNNNNTNSNNSNNNNGNSNNNSTKNKKNKKQEIVDL